MAKFKFNPFTKNFDVTTNKISEINWLQTELDNKADLVGGKVPQDQLPSYVDDVIEVANFAALPVTGETGKIYVTLDTNKTYRWSWSVYIELNPQDLSNYYTKTETDTEIDTAVSTKVDTVVKWTNVMHIFREPSWLWNEDGAVTGAIAIKITNLYEQTLSWSMKLTITQNWVAAGDYPDYEFDLAWNWRSSDHTWYNTEARMLSSKRNFVNVRFCNDWTDVFIVIWNTNTIWNYPRVVIKEVITNALISWYEPDFEISRITSLPSNVNSSIEILPPMPVKRRSVGMWSYQNLINWQNPVQFNTIFQNDFDMNLTQWNWYQIIVPETWLYNLDLCITTTWTTLSPTWYILFILFKNWIPIKYLQRENNNTGSTDSSWRCIVSLNSVTEQFQQRDLLHVWIYVSTMSWTNWSIVAGLAQSLFGLTKIA